MITYSQAFYDLRNTLQSIYDLGEATAITHEMLEHITSLGKLDRLMDRTMVLTGEQYNTYTSAKAALSLGTPLQYVTGIAYFMGKPFKVNNSVLIPRPETEELVQWIIDDHQTNDKTDVLDIGTGSGCIPIAIKAALPEANVTSCDISTDALAVAKENAGFINADINFIQLDFLEEENWKQLGMYDIIVSNPPYIPEHEREHMHINVKDHEPSLALFVPSEDAQLFYREIAAFGINHLNDNGTVYCELHKDHANDTLQLFVEAGYDAQVKNDLNGHPRMLKAVLNKNVAV